MVLIEFHDKAAFFLGHLRPMGLLWLGQGTLRGELLGLLRCVEEGCSVVRRGHGVAEGGGQLEARVFRAWRNVGRVTLHSEIRQGVLCVATASWGLADWGRPPLYQAALQGLMVPLRHIWGLN